jgi:hypothetical protein
VQPETVEEEPERAEPHAATGRAQEGRTEALVEEGVPEVTWAPRPCGC